LVICADERFTPISGPKVDAQLEGRLARFRERLDTNDCADPDIDLLKVCIGE
jgi:hypothetical protein